MYYVYSKNDCRFCKAAKAILELADKEYKELIIDIDISKEDVLSKFPGITSVPIISLADETIGGYNELLEHLSQETADGRS